MSSKRNNPIVGKKAAVIIIVIVIAAFAIVYLLLYHPTGPSSNCFDITAYHQNTNGTLSAVNGTYMSRNNILSLIQQYGAAGCCGEAALNSIGPNASAAYGLTSQYNTALSNATSACSASGSNPSN
jgi:hypothetical protein